MEADLQSLFARVEKVDEGFQQVRKLNYFYPTDTECEMNDDDRRIWEGNEASHSNHESVS